MLGREKSDILPKINTFSCLKATFWCFSNFTDLVIKTFDHTSIDK